MRKAMFLHDLRIVAVQVTSPLYAVPPRIEALVAAKRILTSVEPYRDLSKWLRRSGATGYRLSWIQGALFAVLPGILRCRRT